MAGVVEAAARRRENGEAIESELAQMDPLPLARLIELSADEDACLPAAKDELARRERSSPKDARPFDPASLTSTSPITHAA